MSENTTTTASTPDTSGNGTPFSDEQLAHLLKLAEKERERQAKAEEAKEARKRANNRPVGPDGKEMSASAGFVTVAAQLISEWARIYAKDPAQFMRKVRDQVVPIMVTVGNTPSIVAGPTYDGNRKTLQAFMPEPGTRPVDAPKSDGK